MEGTWNKGENGLRKKERRIIDDLISSAVDLTEMLKSGHAGLGTETTEAEKKFNKNLNKAIETFKLK